jgi:hypothetical protein
MALKIQSSQNRLTLDRNDALNSAVANEEILVRSSTGRQVK